MSQESGEKFARTFRKSSCERGVFLVFLDEGQITHLICARLKYDLYDFFRGCLGPASCSFFLYKRPKHTP